MDALWGEREPLPPGPPGGAPRPAAWCPSSQGEEGARQTPWPQKESQSAGGGPKAAAQKCLRSPNTGATRGQCIARNCRQGAFEPSLVESISPEVALIVPLSALTPKAHPIGYLPFITKRCGILVFSFFFFLEYSKNERLYLGEFQWDRACVLRRDGAARAR